MSTTLTPASQPATPSGPGSSDDPRALRLVGVLVSALPPTLGTPAEPDLYTVPAVFSRQVTAQERGRIEDPATALELADSAGLAPGLEVADRRLLIHHTNLKQLKDGLAASIGAMLARLGQELLAEQDRLSAAAEDRQVDERERLEAVAKAAAEIHFGPVGGEPEPTTAD